MIYTLGIILIIIGLDQGLKNYAKKKFKNKKIYKGPFTFSLVKNKGAFKGFLKNKPNILKALQILGSVIMIIMALTSAVKNKNKILTIGLALIAGGATGNLIDRLRDGEVTDFIAIKWTKNLYYNLADFAIFIGAFILFLKNLF